MADVISITERPVDGIGREAGSLLAWQNSDYSYEWAIAGLPFLSGASDRYPSARGLVQIQKQQIDTSGDAGEQTLQQWWTRSQRDWSGGAGQDYLEPPDDDLVMRRFYDSCNVNVWESGHIKLLNKTELATSTAGAPVIASISDLTSGDEYVFYSDGTTYGLIKPDGSVTTETGTPPVAITSQGNTVFGVASNGDVVKYTVNAAVVGESVIYTGLTSSARLFYVKERIIAVDGASVYQLSPNNGGGAVPAAIYTHTDTAWVWVDAAETPKSIIIAGRTGSSGDVYQFTVTDTGGAQTLDQGRVIAELPNGEYPTALKTYIGTYLLIGSNLGARVGAISESDTIAYGPLSYDKSQVEFIELQGKYAYLGVTAAIDDRSGVFKSGMVRLDLSEPSDQNFYAYANDQVVASTAAVSGLAQKGATGTFAIACDDGAVYTTSSELAEFGYLRTSRVRYSTLEDKSFRFLKLVHGNGSVGRVTVMGLDDMDQEASVNSYDSNSQLMRDVGVQPDTPQQFMSFIITLNRDTVSTGPIIDGYTIKAIPLIERKQIVRVPLLCFDTERDRHGVTRGKTGDALVRYRDLRDRISTGEPVLMQDLVTAESLIGVVEDMEFNQTSPPAGTSGFGGVVYVTLREL